MKKKLVIALVLLCSVALLFASGAKEASAPQQKTIKDTIRIGMTTILSDVVPYNNNTGNLIFLYNLYLDPLVRKTNTLSTEFEPNLAESWDISADSLKYTFHLRKDVYFTNGEHLTSADVVWSLETAQTYGSQKAKFVKVSKIYAPDDYTVVIELNDVEAELLMYLASLNLSILNRKAIEADPENGWLVGTGPYKVVENIAKDHVLFERNENYWGGADKVKSNHIEAVYVTEASSRSIAVQTGELDFAMNLNTNDLSSFDMYDNAKVEMVNTYGLVYAALNVSGKAPQNDALQDIHFRRALNYATDVESILAICCDGIGETPDGVIPKGYPFWSEPDVKYGFDLEKAKQEIAQTKYANGVTLQINCSSSTYPGLFEVLKDQWSKIGVNLEITTTGTASNVLYDVIVAKWTPSSLHAMMVAMWTENNSSRTKDFSNEALVWPCSSVLMRLRELHAMPSSRTHVSRMHVRSLSGSLTSAMVSTSTSRAMSSIHAGRSLTSDSSTATSKSTIKFQQSNIFGREG
ncbi:MAG: hypothetical protein IJ863_03195 [Spirochaetales bacterium]|nr:hypothetical protein [Spirochaetales bacterium]